MNSHQRRVDRRRLWRLGASLWTGAPVVVPPFVFSNEDLAAWAADYIPTLRDRGLIPAVRGSNGTTP
jgi:hypothetical protein